MQVLNNEYISEFSLMMKQSVFLFIALSMLGYKPTTYIVYPLLCDITINYGKHAQHLEWINETTLEYLKICKNYYNR